MRYSMVSNATLALVLTVHTVDVGSLEIYQNTAHRVTEPQIRKALENIAYSNICTGDEQGNN